MSEFLNGKVVLHRGDCRDVIKTFADNSVDSCVTDPPYSLTSQVTTRRSAFPGKYAGKENAKRGFMGKQWDTGEVAFDPEFWAEVYRVLKPGAHLFAMGGTRTYHHLAMAIELAGFEIRDQIGWCYGSGFPKSHDVSKGIDRLYGAEREYLGEGQYASRKPRPYSGGNSLHISQDDPREGHPITAAATPQAQQWEGWGTALKPAWEPIVLARKPLSEKSVAANVLKWGTGALNIDGCRIATDWKAERGETWLRSGNQAKPDEQWQGPSTKQKKTCADRVSNLGRWPANLIHDGSEEVVERFPESGGGSGGPKEVTRFRGKGWKNTSIGEVPAIDNFGGHGLAARFFYTAKADSDDRLGSKHPTVKPIDLIQYLCRLITPPNGTCLDPFAGTGTLGEAAWREGHRAVLIEREEEYQRDIERRMALCLAGPKERARELIRASGKVENAGPLFGGAT